MKGIHLTGVSILLVALLSSGCAHMDDRRGPASNGKHPAQASDTMNTWVEMGPLGAIVRAIVDGHADCPELKVDGQTVAFQLRSGATANSHFPNAVCEAALPADARNVTLNGKALPLISSAPRKILVLGDTGCRVKSKASGKVQVQNCNDPENGWPFAELAQSAAQLHPDLIVHVGDYHYRESACPPGNTQCEGSPYGDTWDSWNADFFTPAQPLLGAAPWIFVRGNHEICQRAQEGFFRFLDPRPMESSCIETTDPYLVSLPGLTFVVMDSAQDSPSAKTVNDLERLQVKNALLVTHRPLWVSNEEAIQGAGDGDPGETPSAPSSTAAVGVPVNVGLVVTGHQHLFRALSFKDQRPVQITAGNGGTELEGHPVEDAPGTWMDGGSTTLATASSLVDFGFVMFEKQADASWVMNLYDKKGARSGKCRISSLEAAPSARRISCSIGAASSKIKSKKKTAK